MRMMSGDCNRVPLTSGYFGLTTAVGVVAVLAGFLKFGSPPPAKALPSFARQTGQPCGACHTDFPALTPFGRRFKIGGYTLGGGDFRTTLFPASEDPKKALAAYAKTTAPGPEKKGQSSGQDDIWVPPISVM